MLTGPPNADEAPKPTSSSRAMMMFGAPAGGRSRVIGGATYSGSFASYAVNPTYGRSGIGRMVRVSGSPAWTGAD